MLVAAGWIVIGFFLLIKGADFLVDGSSGLAKRFHIPEIIIGLTIVSIGTSMPELFVSLTSAIDGYPDMAIGNVVGSNIVNLLFILGISAIIKNIDIQKETKVYEIPICLFITIAFMALCNIGNDITRIDAGILIFLFALFIGYTIFMAFREKKNNESSAQQDEEKKNPLWKDILYIIGGAVALKFGGDLVVDNAVEIANIFSVSEKLISITILAIGTSLPELVTSVSAAIKGNSDIAIGNIIGSNIFNMLLIIGTSALVKPIVYNVSYNLDMAILLISTIMLAIFPFIKPKDKMSRMNGIIYVLMYMVYMIISFAR